MEFREHLPANCPPLDAKSHSMDVYCLVEGDEPVEEDFLSLKERKPDKNFPDILLECQACGLSVFTDIVGVELAKAVSRQLRKKKIAKGYLSENSGKIKNTPSKNTGETHHTWWPSQNIQPSKLFKVIS